MNKYPLYDPKRRDQFLHEFKDRGMIKWFGFYLSDHSAAIRKQKKQEFETLTQKHHLQMDFSKIADTISLALTQQKRVMIEINTSNIKNGEIVDPAPIYGHIKGRTDDGLVIGNKEIYYNNIRYISIIESKK